MLSELYNSLASFFNNYIFKLFQGEINTRILMIGLDGAGKTSILYKLKLGEIVSTIPTIGFNVETVSVGKLNMTIWDVGGQHKLRGLWRHYYTGTNAVIFVVDSNDRERMSEVRDEINNICTQDELRDAHLLIFANKQDLPNAMSTNEIVDSLQLNSIKNKKWYVQNCCAMNSDGIYEGFDWISNALKNK